MKTIFLPLLTLLLICSCTSKTEAETSDVILPETLEIIETDTVKEISIFEGFEDANFKLNYFHTTGYSSGNRYYYEVILVDSLIILNFKSPQNDDWDYISYQKRFVVENDQLEKIKEVVNKANLYQKNEGIPNWGDFDWCGSAYGAKKLWVESENINIAGGMVYLTIGEGNENSKKYKKRTGDEMKKSTTIGGDYETLFIELEKLFKSLSVLMEDKNNHSINHPL